MSRCNDLISREAVIREILRFKGYLDEDMIFRINFAINRITAVETNVLSPRARAVITAYTGAAMLKGDKLKYFYEYLKELYGYDVYTHEIPWLPDIADRAKADFLALCAEVNDDGNEPD